MELMEHQLEAVEHLGNGKILWGGVGAGKSATVLQYYIEKESPRHIYVITTAKKRDSLDWEVEAAKFGIGFPDTNHGLLEVNSWNNLWKYEGVKDAFFIFDEQRLVGRGSWVRSFLKIAAKNHWVLLSATPGDTWLDYAPVFIANGFYKNASQFKQRHVIYEPFVKYPKIRGYINERKLEVLRNDILVEMPYVSKAERFLNEIPVSYNEKLVKKVTKDRWHVYEQRPIIDAAEMYRVMRRVVNSDPSRLEALRFLMAFHPRLIVFYTFDYELEILRTLSKEIDVFEWNGHRHDELPESDGHDSWIFLVQYTAGAEGWNCTSTDSMVLYSLTYSYKNFIQCQGRIDRLNTFYASLYYYIFVSNSEMDRGIKWSLDHKKNFNERKFIREYLIPEKSDEFVQI